MKRIVFYFWSGGLIAVLFCAAVWAQATAQISGTARDQSGAVLPGVEITVTQSDTGISRSTVSAAGRAEVCILIWSDLS